jgi:mannosyltransferase OCH1-like enzyme
MKIPKLIHQIWIGPHSGPEPLMRTWQQKNPDWDYCLWTEETLPKLRNQEAYEATPEWSGKADIIRYELLFDYGGFFIDADSRCLRPLPDDLLDNECFAVWENEELRKGLISNGYLASVPGCLLMKALIDQIGKLDSGILQKYLPWKITGPVLLTNMVQALNYTGLRIYPSWYFIPRHHTGFLSPRADESYADQYWLSTSQTPEVRRKGWKQSESTE